MKTTNWSKWIGAGIATALLSLQSAAAVYVGAGVGYMIDAEEELFTVRIGMDVAGDETISHNLEFEIGYISDSEEETWDDIVVKADWDVIPLMLNYRLTGSMQEGLGYYFGVGLGMSEFSVDGSALGYSVSASDWVFTGQGFLGASYAFTENFSMSLGYRYIYLSEPSLIDGDDMGTIDDHVFEVGLTLKF
jgi:opacity protein-like surface antigen